MAPPRRQQIDARKIGRFVGIVIVGGGSSGCTGRISPKTVAPGIAPRSAPEASVKFLLELLVVVIRHVIQPLLVTETGLAGIGGAPDTAVLRRHRVGIRVVMRRGRRGTRHGACWYRQRLLLFG